MRKCLIVGLIFLLVGCNGDDVKKRTGAESFAKLCKGLPTTYTYKQGAFRWDWEIIVTCNRGN